MLAADRGAAWRPARSCSECVGMSQPGPKQTYPQEEVTEILKRALRQQGLRGERLSHDDLVEMADEVGIDRESLEAAARDLAQTHSDDLTHQDEARELAAERARNFNRFVSSLFTYAVVGVILYFVDLKASGGTWFYWPLMGFGVVLAFQLRAVFFPHEGLERRRRRERKEQERLERPEARPVWRRRLQSGVPPAPPPPALHPVPQEI